MGTFDRQSWRAWWRLAKAAVAAWSDDYAPSMGAALAYYSVFSMAPLLAIVIAVAGMVFGAEAARGEVFGQLRGLMGDDSARTIESLLDSFGQPSRGIPSALAGLAVTLIGATTVFGELQDALDRIWRAPARDRSGGVWGLVRSRLLSFGMILGIAFLLMVSLVLSAAISALGHWSSQVLVGWELWLQGLNLVFGFALTAVVFAMIYKLMPRVAVRWRDVWLGAVATAVLFSAGRFLIGLYIGKSGIASGFGAAGSVAVIFVWVYYSAQIFLLGAEFTWVYAKTFGSMRGHFEPPKTAAAVPHAMPTAASPEAMPMPRGSDGSAAG